MTPMIELTQRLCPIREYRIAYIEHGTSMTITALAKAICVSTSAVSSWERGTRTANIEALKKVAKVLQVHAPSLWIEYVQWIRDKEREEQ